MLAVLIFDQLNDVVYLRCDHKFVRHVRSMAASQRLLGEGEVDLDEVTQLDPNIVVQLFSPLVTSQRIMATQFNNPYTSVSCKDGTNVVFKELASAGGMGGWGGAFYCTILALLLVVRLE